ncbi:hypothetical protein [Marinobacter salarius]|uniref:IPT/TIG domain-containing protein n=1 Tax=Marinobacter salarius TaxID=1420917 RepID=A0A1W6K994_9GAMM|nr:hypothetical protein [Marinobacter salarius]ARM83981.1 hypothetical protein MARSALSMR5_01903 [Marinobacter salarius]
MSQEGTLVEVTNGGSYTAEAGSNRIVVFYLQSDGGTNTNAFDTASFGAQPATIVGQNNSDSEMSGIAIVKEADIPAGANAVTVTHTETGVGEDAIAVHAITLSGRDQAAALPATTGAEAAAVTPWTGTHTGALLNSDIALCLAGVIPSRSPTASAPPFTLLRGANEGTLAGGALLAEAVPAGAASFDVDWSNSNAGSWVAVEFPVTGAGPSGPSLDTIPSTAYPGQSRTVSGSGFGATQGTGGLTIGGVSQTITSWSDTSITLTTVLGANSYGSGKTIEVTTDDDDTDSGTIELVANTAGGFGVVTMSSPNTADESSVAYGATPTVVTGDQFEWEDFNDLGNLAVGETGFVTNVDAPGIFRGRFRDASDGTWGSVNTFTASATDETAPTISSASVPTAGNNIAVQMDESMQVGAGGSGGWTISLGDATVTSAAVDGSDDTIVNLTPSRTLTDEDTLTIGYTQPGDGFQDQADTPNDLATLSGQAVTNNSTQQPPDVTGPVTQSVGVPTAGTYATGDDLSFTVNWDEAVTVTGTPALNLDIGGTSRQADYVSGSGSSALVFTYTVQAGDEDDNGIAVSSLTLEGGTLQDVSSNNATLTLNSVGDTSGVLVDGVAPVVSINALTTTDITPVVNGSAGDATSLTLVVNSVTYNPTPSGGTWSQQLPELALDTYPMTLNGQDAAGNDAVEATATLSVVAELPPGVIGRVKQSRPRSNRRYPARV